jgi:TM2 domain-containing membrane protein YozV
MDELILMQDMTDSQRMMFQSQMANLRKDPTVGVLLAFFLGGFGGHRFYMGQIGLGVLYVVFFWTFIPAIVAFVEIFLMSKRVRGYNTQKAMEVASQIKMLAPRLTALPAVA